MNLKDAITKYGYGILVTMLLAGSLFLDLPVYVCEGNDPPVRECVRVSDSGRTCYFETGRDLCADGGIWLKIEEKVLSEPHLEEVKVRANNKEWNCAILDGYVSQYTECYSDDKHGYLGEFI